MKKLLVTTLIVGATLSTAACSTYGQGERDTAAPYSQSRTATHGDVETRTVTRTPVREVRAERVFREQQQK